MKKFICIYFVTILFVKVSSGQSQPNNIAPTGGGASCTCTPPSSSTCSANCIFSDCCICWNPNTQTGACGCYWGVATCRNENNSTNSVLNSTNFGVLNPNAKIKFSFEKFNLLFNFFKAKGVNTEIMENSFLSIKSKYVLSGQKIEIANSDFAQILAEYSKLIDLLDLKQKEELNIYIKSLN